MLDLYKTNKDKNYSKEKLAFKCKNRIKIGPSIWNNTNWGRDFHIALFIFVIILDKNTVYRNKRTKRM